MKAKIFAHLAEDNLAVISFDDVYCQQIALGHTTKGDVLFVSSELNIENGVLLDETGFTIIKDAVQGRRVDLSEASNLRGKHNAQNAAFAFLLASKVSDNFEGLVSGFHTFPGLEHRMQQIATLIEINHTDNLKRTILFVNDSKATNAEASEQALKSFSEIYWIAGGVAKEGGIEGLTSHLGGVRCAFLIGEAAAGFAESLKKAKVPFEICNDLETAVHHALVEAQKVKEGEGAILLSPAAASFDQYPNFEVRGAAFSSLVQELEGVSMIQGQRQKEKA